MSKGVRNNQNVRGCLVSSNQLVWGVFGRQSFCPRGPSVAMICPRGSSNQIIWGGNHHVEGGL